MSINNRPVAAGSAAFIALLVAGIIANEGFSEKPYIPTKGDVPTIGHGTTVYPDGSRVSLQDAPVTRELAENFVFDYVTKDTERFLKTLPPGLRLWPYEQYAGLDFSYQFGIANWSGSSMLRNWKTGNYRQACDAFLMWKKQGGRDCSDPVAGGWGKPWGCKGVWMRQLKRHQLCLGNITIEEYKK